VDRSSQSHRVVLALLALGMISACKDKESLGANCLTPRQACAGKSCGDVCSACSEGSLATPDIAGTCGADGVCAVAAPSCGQVDGGSSAGCGKTGAATGQLIGQSITVAGQTRTYALSVPTGYTGITPLALVLAWHGANIDGSLGPHALQSRIELQWCSHLRLPGWIGRGWMGCVVGKCRFSVVRGARELSFVELLHRSESHLQHRPQHGGGDDKCPWLLLR
jgi:hypothetical protein